MIRALSALLFVGLLSLSSPSRAFTPESGWWWSPAESGYGFSIEIQDNFIFMVAFSYDSAGRPTWYAAQGVMPNNARFSAPLYHRTGGPCIGCPFQSPGAPFAIGGTIQIDFTSETTARLTFGSPARQINIQRMDYYLSRNPAIDPKTELWLGEWQAVLDFSNFDQHAGLPFFGEIMVFDLIERDASGDYADGCRPENSLVGLCDQFALDNHSAVVEYWEPDGTNLIIVQDSANEVLVFEVEVGTYQFDGYAKLCPANITNVFTQCLDNNARPVIPVRGWRSASRAYVEGDDDAPSSRPDAPVAGKRGSVGEMLSRFGVSGKLAVESSEPVRERAFDTTAVSQRLLDRIQQAPRKSNQLD